MWNAQFETLPSVRCRSECTVVGDKLLRRSDTASIELDQSPDPSVSNHLHPLNLSSPADRNINPRRPVGKSPSGWLLTGGLYDHRAGVCSSLRGPNKRSAAYGKRRWWARWTASSGIEGRTTRARRRPGVTVSYGDRDTNDVLCRPKDGARLRHQRWRSVSEWVWVCQTVKVCRQRSRFYILTLMDRVSTENHKIRK